MKNYSHIKLEKGEILVPENITPETKSLPLEDRYGRPKWINTNQCWCARDAVTDCRFHSTKGKRDPGWEVCPAKPKFPDAENAPKGKWLYASNPDFGKPMPKEVEAKDDPSDVSEGATA